MTLPRVLAPRTLAFVGHFLRAYPRQTVAMVAALTFAALAEGVGLLTLLPMLELLTETPADELSSPSRSMLAGLERLGLTPSIGTLLSAIVLAFGVKGVLHYVAMRRVGFTVARVGNDLRLELIDALMHARWAHFVHQPLGRLANAISSEAHRSSWGYLSVCSALAESLQIVVYGVLLATLSWPVALLLLGVALALSLAFGRLVRHSREAGDRSTTHLQGLVRRLAELLPGLKAIKAMGLERTAWPLIAQEADDFRRAQQRTVTAREALHSAYEPVLAITLALVAWGTLQTRALGVAELLLMAALAQRAMVRIGLLQGHYQSIATNESAYFALRGEIDAARAAVESSSAPLVEPFPGASLNETLELRGVSFAHGEQTVLDGVDLALDAPGLYAVTGSSGTGKTTLLDLLVGLRRPTSGSIRVDGVPIESLDPGSWRRQIGYLPQQPLLFHDTVRRNLWLRSAAESHPQSDRDLEAVLEQVGALDFVRALPQGLDTSVGEGGARLSGGQRQRLCLARTLLRRPSLLLLDEATSALDPESARSICDTLSALRSEMTIVAVSHRETVHAIADRLFRLEDGRLVEETRP